MIPDFFKPIKSPLDSLPYGFSWKRWLTRNAAENSALASDALHAATITAAPTGLTIGSTVIDSSGTIARATISGGVDGTDYTLSCSVTTSAGLVAVAEETLQVRVDAR